MSKKSSFDKKTQKKIEDIMSKAKEGMKKEGRKHAEYEDVMSAKRKIRVVFMFVSFSHVPRRVHHPTTLHQEAVPVETFSAIEGPDVTLLDVGPAPRASLSKGAAWLSEVDDQYVANIYPSVKTATHGLMLALQPEIRARLEACQIPCDEILLTDDPLPVDPRHTSKIDYARLRSWGQ